MTDINKLKAETEQLDHDQFGKIDKVQNTVTAQDIRQALKSAYASPEWYIGFEVGNSTGANCRRHADAVAINAFPSKGFEIRGFEIKVSKQDLKSELNNGIKSDEIARFCDYWFLVVPKGLADGFTLPPTWGLIEYQCGTLRQKIKAKPLEKIAPTVGFLCALLRGRERVVAEEAKIITAEKEKQIRRNAIGGAKKAEDDLKQLREKLVKVKESTGISLDDWTPTQMIIDRLKAVDSLDLIASNVRHIERYAKNMMDDAKEIQTAVDMIHTVKEAHCD